MYARAHSRTARFVPSTNSSHSEAPGCLDAIRDGDPAAAQVFYAAYASQIRAFLRRHAGFDDVENAVFAILVEATRAIRELDSPTVDDLSQTVRDLSRQAASAIRTSYPHRTPSVSLDAHGDRVNSIMTVLDHNERAVLLRSQLLAETDDEISHHLEIPVLQIRRIRAKARVLFRLSTELTEEYAAAARA